MSSVKVGSKVKLIANSAQSRHTIGTIGHVTVISARDRDGFLLLLISANGLCDSGGTWSYLKDVILLPGELNKSVKII